MLCYVVMLCYQTGHTHTQGIVHEYFWVTRLHGSSPINSTHSNLVFEEENDPSQLENKEVHNVSTHAHINAKHTWTTTLHRKLLLHLIWPNQTLSDFFLKQVEKSGIWMLLARSICSIFIYFLLHSSKKANMLKCRGWRGLCAHRGRSLSTTCAHRLWFICTHKQICTHTNGRAGRGKEGIQRIVRLCAWSQLWHISFHSH